LDIPSWLRGLGLEQYEPAFRENDVDEDVLPRLTSEDLKELGVASIGHRRKLLDAIAKLAPTYDVENGALENVDAGSRQEAEGDPPVAKAPGEPLVERRQLTVLFCDLVGSAALSRALDPEDMRELLRTYQNTVAGEIRRFEGHLAQFLGDGVLAYFGYPRAHEDDAERAVRSGLSILDITSRLRTPTGEPFAVRFGIATGLVVSGDVIGEGATKEDAVVGETPNLAARLQALAEPNSILIAAATRRLVGGAFDLDALPPQTLKGFVDPVSVWRVVGSRKVESRFEAQTGGVTPMIGREQEIALLLARWQQAREGEGQVVLLSGEPGIGKSRITRAVIQQVEADAHIRLRYQCSPYYANTALYPVIDQLERAAGLVRGDTFSTKLDKLEALLGQGTSQVRDVVPLIAALLSLPIEGRYPPLTYTPQRQKELTITALLDQLLGLAKGHPVLAIFEDVHWADPTTLELLGQIIDRIENARVLLLVTFRPEFTPPWKSRSHVTTYSLTRLGRRQSAALITKMTGGKELPPEVLDQIIAKTDGVPLFVEELTKTVLEAGFIREEGGRYILVGVLPPLAIPSTLQDSLMARLDRLAPVKEVAQLGAVIGREFSYELLATLSPLRPPELQAALTQLIASELVFVRGTLPDATYTFKHALVQDTAYSTLLRGARQNLHQRIAEALEQRFPETTETQPEIVAHHYTNAGLAAPAIDYWRKAGERALQRSANAEASAHLRAAIALIAALPADANLRRKELDLQMALGSATRAIKGHASDETLRVYSRARELLDETVSVKDQIGILYGLWSVNAVRGEYLAGLETAKQSLAVAERHQEPEASAFADRMMGFTLWATGRFSEAAPHLRQAVALYAPGQGNVTDLRYSQDHAVWAQMMLALTLWALGYPQQAASAATQSIAWARAIGHAMTTGFALAFGSVLNAFLIFDRSGGGAFSEQAVRYCLEQDLRAYQPWAQFYHGLTLFRQGEHTSGLEAMLAGMDKAEKINFNSVRALHLSYVASARAATNQLEAALEGFDEAFAIVERTAERIFEAELHRMHSDVLARAGCVAQAEEALGRALTIARDQQARMWELRAATGLARLWIEQGKQHEARELLAPVLGWFTEGFDTADLRAARSVLDAIV
jgi:class 3 adenylate cyclase/tetratricopeptide (TPR) repeat protein